MAHRIEKQRLPKHVAIIMDGNGRWATDRLRPRWHGHLRGALRAKKIIMHADFLGIQVLTLWGYSTDNQSRPNNEKKALMKIFHKFMTREKEELVAKNVRVTFIGDSTGLPEGLQTVMKVLSSVTACNTGLHLQIALNYGGRNELIRAINNAITIGEQVTAESFSSLLDTSGVIDPDLIIRTSGENRLSGFMPWQSNHSELVFTDEKWPDFTPMHFEAAIFEFQKRSRRFGGLSVVAAE